jgi:type IV fimbrial biogenesis protein FimT
MSKTTRFTEETIMNTPRLSQRAFTLIEQIVTIGLLAVIAATADPNFSDALSRLKIRVATSDLHSTLVKARNHAITQKTIVIVCQASNDNRFSCHDQRRRNANWKNGWIAYQDENNNGEFDTSEHVLHTSQNPDRINVVFNQTGRLRFFPDGRARSAGFYVCGDGSDAEGYVRLLYSGRARTSSTLSAKQRLTCQTLARSDS